MGTSVVGWSHSSMVTVGLHKRRHKEEHRKSSESATSPFFPQTDPIDDPFFGDSSGLSSSLWRALRPPFYLMFLSYKHQKVVCYVSELLNFLQRRLLVIVSWSKTDHSLVLSEFPFPNDSYFLSLSALSGQYKSMSLTSPLRPHNVEFASRRRLFLHWPRFQR